MEDGKDVHIPGTGDVGVPDEASIVGFIVDHPLPIAALILAIIGVGLYKRHKILFAFAFGAVLAALFFAIKN